MLASASRSAWRPAPLVGSLAAKVRTAGREGTGSFMGIRGAGMGGLHLKSGLGCVRQPRVTNIDFRSARVLPILLNTPAFTYAFERARTRRCTVQDLALPRLRLHL